MVSAHSHKRRVGLSREQGPGARSCSMEIELWEDVVNEGFLIGGSKETGQEIPHILEVAPGWVRFSWEAIEIRGQRFVSGQRSSSLFSLSMK